MIWYISNAIKKKHCYVYKFYYYDDTYCVLQVVIVDIKLVLHNP